ncbi:DUF2461 domain-containing protein [Paenibacillus oralis]|uniref:DUF2461 domain-containing protein n=1 Tax=Paenibacillus oralis TaxID=2490856 RepID=A0A3P3TVK8_9BACL|nr:DUF2461 domain-containing protein [Paenibacillus oralis]RRJ61784.1 DUF2461 domain-containing protein [Paenibacillus oralis]
MGSVRAGAFQGFSPETLTFLEEVQRNNSKPWFEENRAVYTRVLLEPMQSLVADLSEGMLNIDPLLETRPSVNKTISRIHCDTRFSKDKLLYRNTMWITFKRPSKEWRDAPAFFFELHPDSYRFGMGYYGATKETMDKLREWIDAEPQQFQQVTSFFNSQNTFVIEGERYKRILDPAKSAEVLNWYQRKNLYLVHNEAVNDKLFSSGLVVDLSSGFNLLAELYHSLYKLKAM